MGAACRAETSSRSSDPRPGWPNAALGATVVLVSGCGSSGSKSSAASTAAGSTSTTTAPTTTQSVLTHDAHSLAAGPGAALFAGYTIVAIAIAAVLLVRRDT